MRFENQTREVVNFFKTFCFLSLQHYSCKCRVLNILYKLCRKFKIFKKLVQNPISFFNFFRRKLNSVKNRFFSRNRRIFYHFKASKTTKKIRAKQVLKFYFKFYFKYRICHYFAKKIIIFSGMVKIIKLKHW